MAWHDLLLMGPYETTDGRWPFNYYFHIIHQPSGGLLGISDASMQEGATVRVYPRNATESGGVFADRLDAIEWRFDPFNSCSVTDTEIGPLVIVNRRSGLPLQVSRASQGQGILSQTAAPDVSESPDGDETGLFWVSSVGGAKLGAIIYVKHWDAGAYEEDAPFLYCDNVTSSDVPVDPKLDVLKAFYRPELPHLWRFHPAASSHVKAGSDDKEYKLELDQVGVGYAYAHESLGMLSDIAGTIGNIGNTWSDEEIGKIVGTVGYSIAGLAQLADHIVNFTEITENAQREDPLQTLYKTMMPEIREIFADELVKDNVTDAMAEAAAASVRWRTVARAVKRYAAEQSAGGAGDDQWVFRNMPESQRARISDLLSQADEHFTLSIAQLTNERNANPGFAAFVPIAIEHTAVVLLLGGLHPDVDGSNLTDILGKYSRHTRAQFGRLRNARWDKIEESGNGTWVDKRFGDNREIADKDSYLWHVLRTLDIDFGMPDVARRNWDAILRT